MITFDRCSSLEPRLGLIASQWDISLVQVVCQTPSLINIKIINFTCLLLGAALPLLGGFAEREVMILSKHFLASTQMKIDYFEAVVFPFSLFLASVLICQVFIIFCMDFNLQTPIQREKIFQYFYSTGFFSISSKPQMVRCRGTWRGSSASLQEVPRGEGEWS